MAAENVGDKEHREMVDTNGRCTVQEEKGQT